MALHSYTSVLTLQKEEMGFDHQEVTMPSVPHPDMASNSLTLAFVYNSYCEF